MCAVLLVLIVASAACSKPTEPSTFSLVVAVLDLQNYPVAEANVRLVDVDCGYPPMPICVYDTLTTYTTNESGQAHFEDIPEGSYQIVTTKIGYSDQIQRLGLQGGGTVILVIRLTPLLSFAKTPSSLADSTFVVFGATVRESDIP